MTETSQAGRAATAGASAVAGVSSPKGTARRKTSAQASVDSERRNSKAAAYSTAALRDGPDNLFPGSPGENGHSNLLSCGSAERAALNRGQVVVSEDRPPRSPVRKPKACVPTLEDALDDVQVRFVLNLPEAELSSADRLFFQLEQAWWFFEDFIADVHKHLPHFRLKEFAKLMFEHCDALRPLSFKYNELFEDFRSWKGTIPTAGCILLNPAMTKVVLVKSWKGNSRGIPKGKINQGEPAIAAAVREVKEETGFDASAKANEKDSLSLYLNGQQTTLYIIPGVDESFPFEPQVRKEISAVEWFPLDALPKGCYGVEPFVPRLRRWLAKTKGMRAPKDATADARTQSLIRVRKGRAASPDTSEAEAFSPAGEQPTSPACATAANGNAPYKKQGRKGSKGTGVKGENARACSAPSRRNHVKGCDANNRDTFGGGLDHANGGDGWDFEAMLAANERLTGRTFVYDGNPHGFGEPTQVPASRITGGSPAASAECADGRTCEEVGGGHRKERARRAQQQRPGPEEELMNSSLRVGIAEASKKAGNGTGGGYSDENGYGEEGKAGCGWKCAGGGVSGRGTNRGRKTTGCTANAEEGTNATSGGRSSEGADERITKAGLDCGRSGTAVAEGTTRPRAGPCNGGTGREEGASGFATVWEPSSGESTAANNAGLFGEFKFDMADIMGAVPRR